jgi:two-component system chemotaxis sensor kinase CheA
MDKTKLMQRLMATFRDELEEHVRTLNQDLLALEKNPSPQERSQRLTTLFRTAHSLKGAARSVNVTLIEGACHRLEEILAAARDSQLPLSPDLFGLLFAAADAIEEAGMRLREQQDLADAPLAALLPRLDAAVTGTASPPTRSASDEPPAPKAASAAPAPPAAAVCPSPPVTPSSPHPGKVSSPLGGEPTDSTVRVPAEKLDTLLARIGELRVARRRVESRVADIKTLWEFVTRWKTEWQRVEKLFDRLSRPEDNGPASNDAGRLLPQRAELVLRRTGESLRRVAQELEGLAAAMAEDGRLLRQVAGPIDAEVRRVRMLPFAEACQGLDRVVRDLAQAGGKEVDLVIEGGTVELDRWVLEGLKDPLRHMVRNAVDHGTEAPDRRRAAGKPARARVAVAAALRGAQVEVVVQDDGGGLDLEALRARARKRRLAEPADERELAQLVFLPGLSTSRLITDVSGRGVGLDVVKSRVEALHGTVDVSIAAGGGTRFTLTVPLTLTTLRAIFVGVAGQTFAFAGTNVQKLVRVRPADLRSVAGRDMLSLGGTPLPLASLGAVLGLSNKAIGVLPGLPGREMPVGDAVSPGKDTLPVLVIAAGEKRMAFAVDEFQAEQEILIKSLGARIRRLRHVSGATLLPSGKIALVLNAANLVRTALTRAPARLPVAEEGETAPAVKKRLLVVDDSVTTRTLEKSILEAAGYEVATAVDGKAAWQFLQDQGTDLLVSDVEMPQMDGVELTRFVRASQRFRELPVVLVTARESEQDKTQGLEAGADAYLVKSAFDQKNLLETIAQLL